MKIESELEAEIVAYVHSLGGKCLKLKHTSRGFPDRTVFHPWGKTFFIEVKRPGGKVSIHQKQWNDALKADGFEVFVIDNLERAKQIIDERLRG